MDFLNHFLIAVFTFGIFITGLIAILSSTMISIFIFSIFSLFSAILYLILQAPDVAITETSIGSAVSTVFFIIALRAIYNTIPLNKIKKTKQEKFYLVGKKVSLYGNATLFFIVALFLLIGIFNSFIEISKLDINHFYSASYYIKESFNDTGIKNIVTSILASYRGFDTMIETLVIFVASMCVMFVLKTDDFEEIID